VEGLQEIQGRGIEGDPIADLAEIRRLGREGAAAALLDQLEGEQDRLARGAILAAMGVTQRPEVVPTVSGVLADPSEHFNTRAQAANALGKLRAPEGVEALLGALTDERLELRMMSAEALGRIGDARAVAPLIKATRDIEGGVRADAAEALGAFGGPEVLDALLTCLVDRKVLVRQCAALALQQIGDASVVEALTRLAASAPLRKRRLIRVTAQRLSRMAADAAR
jgi:HEAT repeat protein